MKYLLIFICAILSVSMAFAQNEERPRRDKDEVPSLNQEPRSELAKKIYFGAGLQLGFYNGWNIGIEPLMGYKITPRFSGGVGATYNYSSTNFSDGYSATRYPLKTSNIGGRVFTRYKLFQEIFAHAELQMMNYELPDYDINGYLTPNPDNSIPTIRKTLPGGLVGAGYNSGDLFSYQIMLLYDLLHTRENPYSPFVMRASMVYNF